MITYAQTIIRSERFQALSLVGLALAISILIFLRTAQLAVPPFDYTSPPQLVQPGQTFCPGDTVHYRATSRTSVPAGKRVIIASVRTLWSIAANRTARPATADEIRVVIWLESVTIQGGGTYELPTALEPGPYEIRFGSIIAGQDSETAGAQLPITIREGCPDAE